MLQALSLGTLLPRACCKRFFAGPLPQEYCPSGHRCSNQMFTRREYSNIEVVRAAGLEQGRPASMLWEWGEAAKAANPAWCLALSQPPAPSPPHQNAHTSTRTHTHTHPGAQRRAGAKGFGLFAREDLKAGQFVIEYLGEVLEEEEYHRRWGLAAAFLSCFHSCPPAV